MQFSIVNRVDLDSIKFRIDAEYYKPEYISLNNHILKSDYNTIESLNGKFDCSAFYPSITEFYTFDGKGIPFLRVNEIQDGLVKILPETVFLPKSILDENSSTIAIAKPNDIIIAKGGNSLGKIGLLTSQHNEYSVCRDIIVLKTNSMKKIALHYLWIFLHSSIGQKLILRTASQTGQPHLTVESLKQLKIPRISNSFEEQFSKIFLESQKLYNNSFETYISAESLLLTSLNLYKWNPCSKNSFVRNFSKTQTAARFDAEYFQPKYDEIVNSIKEYKCGWDLLGNLVKIKDKNYLPNNNSEYKYVELANVGSNGEITGYSNLIGFDLPSRARRKITTNDLIVSSIEGSLSSIALIENGLNGAICSTGFYVINSDQINSETLLIYLKTFTGQMLLKKGCSGTILTAINKDEFSKIVIPKFDENIQKEIKAKITEVYNQRNKSKQLLEIAKRCVEIAIEKDENTAQNWIDEQLEINNLSLITIGST